jgi:hypothetical protein
MIRDGLRLPAGCPCHSLGDTLASKPERGGHRSRTHHIDADPLWTNLFGTLAPSMDEIVDDALDAAAASRWDDLKLLLHPYLHFTRPDGVTLRGRTNALGWLSSQSERLARPSRVELRDGQIYRWWSR